MSTTNTKKYHREYYKQNRDSINEAKRRWYHRNREVVKSAASKRNRKFRKVNGVFESTVVNRKSQRYAHQSRKPWTATEDRILMRGGVTLKELAHRLGRSIAAISTRRHNLSNPK